MTAGPLAGVFVVDFTQAIAGPLATRVLADLGARVVKVETLQGDLIRTVQWTGDEDRWSPMFGHGSAGKESIAVDVKHASGHALVDRLLDRADVIVENFRPGSLSRLGWDPPGLVERARHPVVCSVSGFGRAPETSDWSSADPVGQAVSGMTYMLSEPGGTPMLSANGIADTATAMWAATGILGALIERQATGLGRYLDLAMADCMVAMDCVNTPLAAAYGPDLAIEPTGHDHPAVCPFGVFPTSDGHVVIEALGAGPESTWGKLCSAIERPELVTDPRCATQDARLANRTEVNQAIEAWTRGRTRAEVLAVLRPARVIVGPVQSPSEAAHDRMLESRGILADLETSDGGTVGAIALPLTPSGLTCGSRRPPLLGEHTRSVLVGDLQLGDDEVTALLDGGVVASRARWP